ncbi:MAG: TlpA family protein disulfide reductase [Candidatus Velamenicoccus archaeovorus]
MTFRRRLAALIVVASLAAACGSSPAGSGGGADVPTVLATNATTAALLPTDVMALPTFDYDRFRELMGQLRGTPVVVNVWASWCGPCREEGPRLAEAATTFGSRVQFLGIDILDARPSARSFMQREGWTYPSLYDPRGSIRDGLGFFGQPVTVFFDASGRPVSSWSGPVTAEILRRRIRQLLA